MLRILESEKSKILARLMGPEVEKKLCAFAADRRDFSQRTNRTEEPLMLGTGRWSDPLSRRKFDSKSYTAQIGKLERAHV